MAPTIKSPNVSNLGTFGEIPVSLFTGTADISIPLTELKGKDLTLPIVLRYHPASIKPNQRNGWLGVGWSVSMGTIYREVRGYPDEMSSTDTKNTGYYYRTAYPNDKPWYKRAEAPELSWIERIGLHKQLSQNTDLEPDIFHFNVMGLQGSFFLDEVGKWHVQSDKYVSVELDTETPLIDPLTMSDFGNPEGISKCFNKFILRDGYGNKYIFGGVEATEYTSTIDRTLSKSGKALHASSWSIIEIQSANQVDKINFKYERGPYVSSLYKYAQYNQATEIESGCKSEHYDNWLFAGSLVFPVYPKEVTLNNQKLIFKMSNSKELNYSMSDHYKKINPPKEIDPENLVQMGNLINSGWHHVPYYNYGKVSIIGDFYKKLIWMKLDEINLSVDNTPLQTIDFEYNNTATERLFLTNLKQYGQDTTKAFNYSFVYNQKEKMPAYLASISDHWGFDNGNSFPSSFSSDIFSQRQPDSNYLTRGILKEINYPTGGKAVFDYQIGDYSKIVDKNDRKSLSQEYGYGGLRIWKINSYDENNNLALEKEYIYNKNAVNGGTISSGILNNKPLYYIATTSGILMSGGSFSFSAFKSSTVENLTDGGGVSIGYSEVTEITHSNDSKYYKTETFSNHDNGYTDDNPTYNYNADLIMNKPVNSRSFERGRTLQTILYNDEKIKVKSTRNTWENEAAETSLSRAIMFNYLDIGTQKCNIAYYYPSSVSYLNYYHPVILKGTVDTLFTNQSTIVNNNALEYYSNYKLLKKNTSESSLGESLTTNYKYSFAYGSGISDSYSVYDKMIKNNMLFYPIEETTTKNNKVIQAQITEYGDFKNIIKPASSFLLETASPLTSYSQSSPVGPTGKLQKDAGMFPLEEVLRYDAFGNPIEIKRLGNLITSYLWGYNGKYLIAEIKNADYESIKLLRGDSIAIFSAITNPAKVAVDAFLAPLKNSLKNAFITSYTYRPLIGMASQTDAKKLTTYYTYDHFNRLQHVKNQDGAIIKSYAYNYVGAKTTSPIRHYNEAQSQVFTKNNCPFGQIGSQVTYSVPEKKYSSFESVEDANLLALADISSNGQVYANNNGNCSISTSNCNSFKISIPVSLSNNLYVNYTPCGSNSSIIKAVSALPQEDESSDSLVVILCITGNTPNFRFQYGINGSTQTINRISIESMGTCP